MRKEGSLPFLRYVYSSSLDTEVQIKICSLDGLHCKRDYDRMLRDDMVIYSGLYQMNKAAELMVICQLFSDGRSLTLPVSSCYKSFGSNCNWNEWIKFPLKFSELPRNALLALTVYDCEGPNKLKPVGGTTVSLFGKYGLFRQGLLDLYVWPDVSADGCHIRTPGKFKKTNNRMQNLYRLMRKYRNELIPKVDWLDRLSFREMEIICDVFKKTGNELYLMIEFPQILYNDMNVLVVYYEEESETVYQLNPFHINFVRDAEIFQENLVEEKHHKLSRSSRNRAPDKEVKPNSLTRDRLRNIVAYPPMTSLTADEQDLVWKYRFYLSDQKKALIKFLKCVDWNLGVEVQQALDMMTKWAPMDVDDALQLLTPAFTHPAVRHYAVNCLKLTSDDTLLLYLLQLVQALKYENIDNIIKVFHEIQLIIAERESGINNFLELFIKKCSALSTDLLSFLIFRACHSTKLGNYFYWYLTAEYEDCASSAVSDKVADMYKKIKVLYMQSLKYGDIDLQQKYLIHQQQQQFLDALVRLMKLVVKETGNRTNKIAKLQALLSDCDSFRINFQNFNPIPFPLDPDVVIKGVLPSKATLFKSQLMPSRLSFLTSAGLEYMAIFKYGDDLRQDQLVLQVISLIDNLLRRENLDLKLTPYKVLATSSKHGFVQYIHSFSIAEILSKDGSLLSFLRKYHASQTGPYGITVEVMDSYIRSCAGYCVITYLLGVGDRHSDNLMMTPGGNLFHIDFGYILGRDPKPLPPPMKLSREMVEAMGGVNSEHYNEFQKHCFNAFLFLRRHADLILNLFALMIDAKIPDIALEPDKAVKKVEDKLCLTLGDEEAVQYFKKLLDLSVADIMAVLVDQLHKFTQYCRK